MKKTILALSITALFATSTQAANLYEADGIAVDVSGEVDGIYHRLDADNSANDENGEIYSWANVQFDVSTKISDSVTAMASFEIEGGNGEAFKLDDSWVGISGNFGTFKLGETGSSYALLEKTELLNEADDYDVVYSDGEGSGHSLRYEKALGPVALSANYFSETSDTNSTDGFALSADYAIGDFTIGTAYIESSDDISSVGVSASMDMSGLYVATTYTQYNGQAGQLATAHDGSTIALSASYSINAAKVYGSYQIQDADETLTGADIDQTFTTWYIGASYDVTANISTFAEYIATETDGNDAVNAENADLYVGVYYTF